MPNQLASILNKKGSKLWEKATDVPYKFCSWIKQCKSTYYVGAVVTTVYCAQRGKELGFSWQVENSDNWKLTHDLSMPINMKWRTICHCLTVIWQGIFKDPQFWVLEGGDLHQSKTHPTFQYKSVQTFAQPVSLSLFERNSNGNFGCPNWMPHFRGRERIVVSWCFNSWGH